MSFGEKRNSKKECFIIGGLVLCVLVGITIACPPYYSMNDDVMMKSILSGAYTGTPDGHTVYMKYPLSGIISLLYRMTGKVSWFDIVMVGCFWLSISSVVLRIVKSRRVLLIAGVVSLCLALFLPQLLTMHYTLVAAMVGSSGLFLVMTGGGAIATVLFILCYCIRSQVFFLLLPFLGVAVLWRIAGKKREGLFRQLFWVAAGVVLCMLCNQVMYQAEDWKQYMDYNDARTQLYDYEGLLPYEENKATFEEAGISSQQHRIMEEYVLVLDDSVTGGMQKKAADIAAGVRESQRSAVTYLIQCVKEYYYHIMYIDQPYNLLLICAYLLVLVLLLRKWYWVKLLLLCCLAGGRSLIWVFLIWRGRFPERIYVSLYFLELMILAGMIIDLLHSESEVGKAGTDKAGQGKADGLAKSGVDKRVKCYIPQIIGCVAILLLLLAGYRQGREMYGRTIQQAQKQRAWEALLQYCEGHPDTLYLLDVRSMVSYTGRVWDAAQQQENHLLAGGWMSSSPLLIQRLEGAADAGVLLADLEEQCCYVVAVDRDIEWLQDYCNIRFGEMHLERIDSILLDGEEIFNVYCHTEDERDRD